MVSPLLLVSVRPPDASFLSFAGCNGNKVPKRRDVIKDWRDKADRARATVAGLCLQKIKALQDAGMMDGHKPFIHQSLFTSPLNSPAVPSLSALP